MLQIAPNNRSTGNLNITANGRARMSSVLSIDWDNVTGKPNTITGLDSVTGTGLFAITDIAGGAATRTITGTANQITVTNGDGVAGNPTLSTPTALTFTGKTITGGTYTGVVSINGNFWTVGTGTLTLGAGKTLTVSNTLTLAGTDGTTMTFPTTSATIARTDAANTFTGHQTIEGVTSTGATGTGKFVFDTAPVVGVLTATTYNKVTITAPASAATLTLIDGTTLTGPASSGTVMTLGNTETVTGVKTFGSAGAVGRFKLAGTTSGTTVLDATAVASGTLTLPAATDTLMGKATTDILTNKTFNSTGSGNVLQVSGVTVSAGQYPGEPSTGSATAGNVGEPLATTVLVGSAVSMTTATAVTIATLSLTAGDWDVYIQAAFNGTATAVSGLRASLSTTTNVEVTTAGNFGSQVYNAIPAFATENPAFWVGPIRVSLSGTTNHFYVARGDFTGGTCTGYGLLRARRVR